MKTAIRGMNMHKIKTGIAVLALALLAPVAQAAAFSDGGFEDSSFAGTFQTINAGSSFGSWTVLSGSVDLINTYWTPYEGQYSLDLNGNTVGSIAQTFDTVAGKTYTVSFEMAGNTDGGGAVKAIIAGTTNPNFFTFDSAGMTRSNMGWTGESFTFVADSSSTLTFTGFGSNGAYGAALDNITVTAAVPEPETYGMLLAGLGLVGFMARRKKSAA